MMFKDLKTLAEIRDIHVTMHPHGNKVNCLYRQVLIQAETR